MLRIPDTSRSKCNMKLIQLPGEEKLLISKQEAFSFNHFMHNVPKWSDTLLKILKQMLQDF